MRIGLTIVLLISLAVNMLLGGFIAGRLVGGPFPGRFDGEMRPARFDAGPMFVKGLEVLDPDQRKQFRQVLSGHRKEITDGFKKTRELRLALADALAADPWDRAKVDEAVAALQAAESAQQSAIAAAIVSAFETLPADQRKALVEEGKRIESAAHERKRTRRFDGRRGPGGPGGSGRRGDWGPPPEDDDMGPPPPADESAPDPQQ